MILDYFLISLRNLIKRKLRSWLTMIGIFIGIASVVSLIGLGEGLRIAISSQFGFLGTDTLAVQAASLDMAGAPGTSAPTPLTDDLSDKIEDISGVEASINRYIETITIEFNDKQNVGMAMSMPQGENRKVVEKMLNVKAESGRMLKDRDTRKALLGINFADDGMFGKEVAAGDTILINDLSYTVVGIMKGKGSFMFDNAVLINENTFLDDFGDDGTVDVIGVKVKDEDTINKVKEDIENLLRKERNVDEGEEDFEVQSPQKMLETLNSTLFAVQLFVYIIASISIIVGGIGIMNTMYTSVLERTKEIGIMKSIGARNSAIFTLFSIESGFLGMAGGLIGIIIGLILAYGLAFVGKLALGSDLIRAHITPALIIGALLFSFIIGMAAGLVPAYQASKMVPVESLRYAK